MLNPIAGARNLLVECVGVQSGDRLLLMVEPEGAGHYDPALTSFIADRARELGVHVDVMTVQPAGGPESVQPAVMHALSAADHTIFLNRIGDQLRFVPLPGRGTKTMCYALDLGFLGSEFATTPYTAWEGIQARLTAQLGRAQSYTLSCASGTNLSMQLESVGGAQQRAGAFTVKNFPVMIVPPIIASGLSGTLVLSQALTSTYTHAYEESVLPLSSPLTLTIERGEIVGIQGDPALVAQARAQFERVGGLFGGRTWALNSWHAGINAFTFFPRPALADIDRWSCVAFGSPRYAHFHMCGSSPGDICGQVFDPTITFDAEVLWQAGFPAFLTPQEKQSLIASSGLDPRVFDARQDIGIGR
ncbi:MAG: hypothetical protein ABI885_10780 [Gammaproteobacteria bacterium]